MKKVISLILAVLMLASVLGGCGKNVKDSKVTDTKGAAETGEKAKDDSTVPTVIWYFPSDQQADQDQVWEDMNKKLAAKANVKIDFRPIPMGEFDDKMKLISSSGEDYDLAFTANWLNNFYDNVGREAFLPLDDLYEKHPELKEQCPEWLSNVAKSNGKLYAIPNMQIVATQLGLVIRKDLVEKYNFDPSTIKTTDDLINKLPAFLDKIVANEPEIRVPFLPQQLWGIWDYEGISTGTASGSAYGYAYIKKGDTNMKVISSDDFAAFPENKAYSQLQFDWAQKGYFGNDITLLTDVDKLQTAGQVAAVLNIYKPGNDASLAVKYPGYEFVTVPVGTAYTSSSSGGACMTAINVNSKNPEAAMNALAAVYTDKEIFNELLFGLPGTHYNMADETHAEPVANTKYNLSAYAWVLGNQFNSYLLPGQDDNTWTETEKMNNDAEISVLRGFTVDPTPIQSQLAQLNAVAKEYDKFELLAKDQASYEKVLAEKVEKDKKAGIDDVVAEVQRQIDAWKSTLNK
ncbi:putative aldouronate transport system substrate-binding protein [Anaerocolumna jejuensis DSM 15929]|uniref:Putative aldouronate transport system substrate-binding protein n=1 Tax=Anaerocolumna jejuensis DSM 15929 TaxID=1121322 RepID=A0A1M6VSY3_9FIRM|nr:ABC transporter substrate-binding protein [Anaerocolumna jejuensis]SHK84529.1 putative aldouronate transport system substrate-binding protein [Anaerocolumna jejuensis DSM 15929]